MFTGRRAMKAVEDRIVEFLPQCAHPFKVRRVRRIEQRSVMRVPVANVAVDPRDGRMPLCESYEELDELRNPVAWHDGILHEAPGLAGSGALNDCREHRPAELPEARLSLCIFGDVGGATQLVSRGDRPDHGGQNGIEIALVEFDEEHGLRAGRHAVNLAANQIQGGAIDGLHRTRVQGEEIRDERAELPEAIEIQEHGNAPGRDWEDAESNLRHDPECPFAADKEPREREDPAGKRVRDCREVVATGMFPDGTAAREDGLPMPFNLCANALQTRRLLRGLLPFRTVDPEVASGQHGPIEEGDSEGEDVISRLTVFHAPISRGVVSDHPADSTQVLTPGIGSDSNASFG